MVFRWLSRSYKFKFYWEPCQPERWKGHRKVSTKKEEETKKKLDATLEKSQLINKKLAEGGLGTELGEINSNGYPWYLNHSPLYYKDIK